MSINDAIIYLYDIKTDVIYQITSNEKRAIDIAITALETLEKFNNKIDALNKKGEGK